MYESTYLAAVVGEERILMPEEAAALEDGAVAADGDRNGLTGVPGSVLEGKIVGLEAGAIDLHGFGEEGSAGLLRVERVGDDDVFRRFAHADQGDVGVVLRDDDALVIRAGSDLDVHAPARAREGMVVQRHLDGRKLSGGFDAGLDVGRDADVNILGRRQGTQGDAGSKEKRLY